MEASKQTNKRKPEASLLIAAYNQGEFFRRTVMGLRRQTVSDFEVIVCDDGSGPEVESIVKEQASETATPIHHLWHEDRGFRKCEILNRGVLQSSSDYLIFLDADCIPHRRFVEEHIRCREAGKFLTGRRVELGEAITSRLTDDMILSGSLENIVITGLPYLVKKEIRHLEYGIYFPRWARNLGDGGDTALLGCNFSCWKDDFEKINGFNEDFLTPSGGEDVDVERRFRLMGLLSKNVKHGTITYHQHHPIDHSVRGDKDHLCKRLKEEGAIVCQRGLRKLGE